MPKVETNCDTCGKAIMKFPSLVRAHNFCDDACYRMWRRGRTGELSATWKGGPEELVCGHCGRRVDVPHGEATKRKYCSVQCKHAARHPRRYACLQCGTTFFGWRRTFCTFECFVQYRHEHPETSPQWIDGHARSQYTRGWSRSSRRRLVIERDGNRCVVCGIPRVPGKRTHAIHHRDGTRTNHDLSNLVTLCNSCHKRVHAGVLSLPVY